MNSASASRALGRFLKKNAASWLWLALLLGLVSGCRHPGFREYPIGIYGVNSTNDYAVIREAGFNVITSPASQQYLDAARANDLKILATPGTSAGKGFNAARAREYIKSFDSHPALWAWYLSDEPDMHGVPPDHLRDIHRYFKSLGARKPTSLVLYQGASALEYARITDILMIDRYPIPWLPLANFPQHVRMARLGAGKYQPVIAVIQAFDWKAYPKLLNEKDTRPPTHEELRCMTYAALQREASGLFFYCFDDGSWRIRQHPEVWESLRRTVAEVRQREPLFQAEHLWWDYDHNFRDQNTRFNAALEASVSPALLRVRVGNEAVPEGDYVLAVNTTALSHGYRVRLPGAFEGDINVLGEDRTLPIVKNWIEDDLEPYAVRVYGPLPILQRGRGLEGK